MASARPSYQGQRRASLSGDTPPTVGINVIPGLDKYRTVITNIPGQETAESGQRSSLGGPSGQSVGTSRKPSSDGKHKKNRKGTLQNADTSRKSSSDGKTKKNKKTSLQSTGKKSSLDSKSKRSGKGSGDYGRKSPTSQRISENDVSVIYEEPIDKGQENIEKNLTETETESLGAFSMPTNSLRRSLVSGEMRDYLEDQHGDYLSKPDNRSEKYPDPVGPPAELQHGELSFRKAYRGLQRLKLWKKTFTLLGLLLQILGLVTLLATLKHWIVDYILPAPKFMASNTVCERGMACWRDMSRHRRK